VIQIVLVCLGSYFIGSIPFGFLIARLYGLDIRTAGSGNIGATNVTRQLGRGVGALVFILDFAKGAIPVVVAQSLHGPSGLAEAAGLSALVGHMFPVWLRFQGGKGVATGAGVMFVLLPVVAALALVVWLAVLTASRYVSLASIASAAAVCGFHLAFTPAPFDSSQSKLTLFTIVAFLLVVVRHYGNIIRVVRGQEHRISESTAMRSLGKVIHVLSMGLWFGSNVFFIVVTLIVLETWQRYGQMSFNERPVWLPFGGGFNEDAGTRVFGATVAPIFPFFFLVQGVCGLFALITALGFSRAEPTRRLHRVRFMVILVAALTVVGGWPLSQRLDELRIERYNPDASIANPAKKDFGRLHAYSLFLNFGTVILVAIGTALAAFPPTTQPRRDPPQAS
jgi:glycerol-3-phosphate acyltransferase PlsY